MGIAAFLWYVKKITGTEALITLALSAAVLAGLGKIEELMAAVLGLVLLANFSVKNRLLTFLGLISYSLYLMHNTVGPVIISTIKKRTDNVFVELAGLAAAIAATLIFSYLLYYLVERPSQKWSSSIKYKKTV
jgi:peptidoglycan/LPS O-acetylase OafA/YrhL